MAKAKARQFVKENFFGPTRDRSEKAFYRKETENEFRKTYELRAPQNRRAKSGAIGVEGAPSGQLHCLRPTVAVMDFRWNSFSHPSICSGVAGSSEPENVNKRSTSLAAQKKLEGQNSGARGFSALLISIETSRGLGPSNRRKGASDRERERELSKVEHARGQVCTCARHLRMQADSRRACVLQG